VLRKLILSAFLILTAFQLPAPAQTTSGAEKSTAPKTPDSSPAKPGTVESRVEKYLRNLYAWGPEFDITVGPTKPSPIADLLEVPVTVSMGGQSDTAVVYVSKA
jgi:hypothetical protein